MGNALNASDGIVYKGEMDLFDIELNGTGTADKYFAPEPWGTDWPVTTRAELFTGMIAHSGAVRAGYGNPDRFTQHDDFSMLMHRVWGQAYVYNDDNNGTLCLQNYSSTNHGNVAIHTITATNALTVNGNISASGTITSSDERLKQGITSIASDESLAAAAVEISRKVNFAQFEKLRDIVAMKADSEMLIARWAENKPALDKELSAAEKALAGIDSAISKAADPGKLEGDEYTAAARALIQLNQDRKAAVGQVARITDDIASQQKEADAAANVELSPEVNSLGMQAGIIAQELKSLTEKLKAFEWLVERNTEADDSTLVVRWDSLISVVLAGMQIRMDKAGI